MVGKVSGRPGNVWEITIALATNDVEAWCCRSPIVYRNIKNSNIRHMISFGVLHTCNAHRLQFSLLQCTLVWRGPTESPHSEIRRPGLWDENKITWRKRKERDRKWNQMTLPRGSRASRGKNNRSPLGSSASVPMLYPLSSTTNDVE